MKQDNGRRVWSCSFSGEDYEERCALENLLIGRRADYVADARALRRYIALCGLSQEQCARRLGRSQSSVANRLRLMRLPEDVLEGLLAAGLSERHARALLRLRDEDEQRQCLAVMKEQQLSSAEAETLVESLLPGQKRIALESEQFLLRSFERNADFLRRCGVPCRLEHTDTPEALVLTVTVEKRRG